MRRLVLCCALAALLASPAPAAADELTHVEGWSIYDGITACSMSMAFEGPGQSQMTVLLEPGESSIFNLVNRQWKSIEKQRKYDIILKFDDVEYDVSAFGSIDDEAGYRGISVYSSTEAANTLLDSIARSEFIDVSIGDVTVDQLSLKGSAAAVPALRRCFNRAQQRKAAQQAAAQEYERRWGRLTGDPFAKAKEGR